MVIRFPDQYDMMVYKQQRGPFVWNPSLLRCVLGSVLGTLVWSMFVTVAERLTGRLVGQV